MNGGFRSTALSSFRTMVFISIFRPLLTAFLGIESQQGYCSTLLSAAGEPTHAHAASRVLPQRPSLMIVSVPAIQWLVSLVAALSSDMDALRARTTTQPPVRAIGNAYHVGGPVVKALESFQKETSMLFAPMLQCLVGCVDLIEARWSDVFRTRLYGTEYHDAEADRFLEENMHPSGALYLFGQALQAVGAIGDMARKIKTEHGDFCKEFYREMVVLPERVLYHC